PSNGLDPRTEINARGSRTGKGSSVAKAHDKLAGHDPRCRNRIEVRVTLEPQAGARGGRHGVRRRERMCGRVCARVSVRPNQDQAKGGASPGSEEP
ncbi:MAG TPA: hypothetical protein P5525_07705, partial [Candidatus Paceibacterota bacterium]|nr:hypothetical protein [Candidatus Paceibacterota bacterium]